MDSLISVSTALLALTCGVWWGAGKAKLIIDQKKYSEAQFTPEQLKALSVRLPYSVTAGLLFWPVMLLVAVRSWGYEPYSIPSASMEPSLLKGDFIAVEKFSYSLRDPIFRMELLRLGEPERADVVVFKWPLYPAQHFVKRIVGLPGDTIIERDGALFVYPRCDSDRACESIVTRSELDNIEVLGAKSYRIQFDHDTKRSQLEFWRQLNQPMGQWVVPENHYFVIGDNRFHSEDSRYWGFVPRHLMVGVARNIIFSLERDDAVRVRTDRIGSIDMLE
ncbi:signal peptidase I [Neiella sp. HB171785]|uniref:Signal peptidase I n=1 Tax=Neiella litorisoli TaxID=2771431 RepID=A0A8J6QRK5_9GAMM|nr:signal peptidase I [Neiella litorisoli]MBD1389404.1 signal peptidase I [Neiella litorisoli]